MIKTKLDYKEPTLQDRIQEEEVEDYTPQVEITKSLLNGQEMRQTQATRVKLHNIKSGLTTKK